MSGETADRQQLTTGGLGIPEAVKMELLITYS